MTPETLAARRDLLALVLDALVPASDGFPARRRGGARPRPRRGRGVGRPRTAALRRARAVEETRERRRRGLRLAEPDDPRACSAASSSRTPSSSRRCVRRTYDGYYSHPSVIARLGLDAGPLHPRGHRVEAVDLPDLARVPRAARSTTRLAPCRRAPPAPLGAMPGRGVPVTPETGSRLPNAISGRPRPPGRGCPGVTVGLRASEVRRPSPTTIRAERKKSAGSCPSRSKTRPPAYEPSAPALWWKRFAAPKMAPWWAGPKSWPTIVEDSGAVVKNVAPNSAAKR